MKKWSLSFAACAILLAGCASLPAGTGRSLDGFDRRYFRQPDPLFPNVFISTGENILVDQEPIRVPKSDGPRVTITWSLDAQSVYTFLGQGIEVGEKGKPPDRRFDCGVLGSSRKAVACRFNRSEVPAGTEVKYTVRVKGQARDPKPLDPTIMIE